MLSPNLLTHPDFCGHLNGRFEVASGPARHIGRMAASAENETLSSDILDCRRVIGQICELPLPANRLPTCSKEKPSSVRMVFWCLAG